MPKTFAEYDGLIYQEMMTHPALFTHKNAKKVAIIGNDNTALIREILKHPSITAIWQVTTQVISEHDPRVHHFMGDAKAWLATVAPHSFDIIIIPASPVISAFDETLYQTYLSKLDAEGIFLQQSESLFQIQHLKQLGQIMLQAGFHDLQILHFPQPSFPSGWRAAIMATQQKTFKSPSENEIFSKPFFTRYYNFDMHKAALALPEFMRDALEV